MKKLLELLSASSLLLPEAIEIACADNHDAEDFKAKLVEQLKTTSTDFASLNTSNIKIEKINAAKQATILVDEDIVTGLIQVKISAKPTKNSHFTNTKVIRVNLIRVRIAPYHYQFSPRS